MIDINLNCLLRSINPEEEVITDLIKANKDKIDWDWASEFSKKQKIFGIFIDTLEKHNLKKGLPVKIQEKMSLFQEMARVRTSLANLTLEQLNQALNREGIPFLVLKGFIHANELYDDPSVRPFFDIDFLVPQRYVPETEKILISLGYKFYCEPLKRARYIPLGHVPKNAGHHALTEDVTKKFLNKYHHHYQFVPPRDDIRLPLELHWHLFFPGVLKIDPEILWDYITERHINNILVKTFNVESTLIYLATIIAVDGPEFKLLTLSDLLHHIHIFKGQYNTQLLWQIADKWGASEYLEFSLKLVARLYNIDNSVILRYPRRKNIYLHFCFNNGTKPSAIESALIEVCGRRRGIDNFICRLKKIVYSLFWHLALTRVPRQHIRVVIRRMIKYNRKKST